MNSKPSGSGWRTTISGECGPEVSIWAYTEQDADYMAAMEHMRFMEREEDERVKMELAFEDQQREEYRRTRARA